MLDCSLAHFVEPHSRWSLLVQFLLGISKVQVGGCVGYIKVRQLYRVLSSSVHVFLSFRVE